MIGRFALASVMAFCLSGTVAFGQSPATQPSSNAAPSEPSATGSAGRPAAAPSPGGRGPGSLGARAEQRTEARTRRNYTYARCNAMARQRSLRGAERRRFVARCELGYERPVMKP